jgi:AcrR family transcriptional regulator
MAMSPTPDVHGSSQERLLSAAKQLFSSRGYENTSTAMIAREARTSESQLVKHFGGKEGLLEAIFNEGWQKLEEPLSAVDRIQDRREKLRATLELFLRAFEEDPLLKELMLLEAKRVRRQGTGVMLTEGYERFLQRMDDILNQMAANGELQSGVAPAALRSALIGMMEGMLRDQLLYKRVAHGNFPEDKNAMRRIFQLVMSAVTVAPKS